MRPCIRSLGFLTRLLLLAACLSDAHAVAVAQGANETLGPFKLGSYDGAVYLQPKESYLVVMVGVNIPSPRRSVQAENFQVWALLDKGRVAVPRSRPPAGSPLEFNSVAALGFEFENSERPVAVVLKCGDQFQVFPVARMPSR